jgi:hypothetical protein
MLPSVIGIVVPPIGASATKLLPAGVGDLGAGHVTPGSPRVPAFCAPSRARRRSARCNQMPAWTDGSRPASVPASLTVLPKPQGGRWQPGRYCKLAQARLGSHH